MFVERYKIHLLGKVRHVPLKICNVQLTDAPVSFTQKSECHAFFALFALRPRKKQRKSKNHINLTSAHYTPEI